MMAYEPIDLSEDDLRGLKNAEEPVFEKVFLHFQPRIYRFLWVKLHRIEIAEDLTQETFYRLWRARPDVRTLKQLETYLFKTAYRLLIDHLRKHAKQGLQIRLSTYEVSHVPEPGEDLQERQLRTQIERILHQLPEGPRNAFILSRFERLSYKQIAEIMHLSVKTVEKHLGHALSAVRDALQKSYNLPSEKNRKK